MKKITNVEMSNIQGGIKCIYHFMAVLPLGIWNVFGNGKSVIECWNNHHKE
ncbi:hypothetical protein [Daejeonella sp.]|uniref:hypothetical protein n=1 Tax=Daejeonella sp. TaxID=2805397 RepID=UPI0025BB8EA4|nr:hypothetical protein [Daejeonella sp.]